MSDAEDLPFPDNSFDLVCGHAVLHHIPDLDVAMREVLRPETGGRFVFAGEPTAEGDVIARSCPNGRGHDHAGVRLPGLRGRYGRPESEIKESEREAALEAVVDLHTFDPDELARLCLRAGAVDVATATDEFTASWFWLAHPNGRGGGAAGSLGWNWFQFAYRGWVGLELADAHVWSAVVPTAGSTTCP